jgi:hypothetical protein
VWDRTDSSLHGAIRTVLHIQDGNQQSDRNLAIDELSAGSILYQPKSADVAFRLDVYSVEPNASGSVQIVALPPLPSAPQPLRAQPKLKAASKQAARILPSIARIQTPSEDVVPAIAEPVKQETAEPPKREREKESAAVLPKSNAAGIIPENPEPPVQIADTRPSPRLPSPKASAVLERPASVSGARQEPSIWVSSEPAPGSRLGQVAARIPLVRRFKSTPKRRLSVYAAKPSLTAADKEELIQPVSVDVKVFVANSGKVTDAEIVRYGDPPSWKLADAALAASHRWTFEPASADDPQIVSELILHFRFSP